jgi:hypothetical protein
MCIPGPLDLAAVFFYQLHELRKLFSIIAIAAGDGDCRHDPDLGFAVSALSMNVHGLQGISFVRVEEKANSLVAEYDGHGVVSIR